MTTRWPSVELGRVLAHRKKFIEIDDLTTYVRPRVQLHAQGIVQRDRLLGAEIKTKKQQVCRAGDFLVAEIDAKVGGFGIVPYSLGGAIVSSHYFLFEIDESQLDRRFLHFYSRTRAFREQVEAQGSTNYAAIRPAHVLAYRLPLPSLPEQRRIVEWIEAIAGRIEEAIRLRGEVEEEASAVFDAAMNDLFSKLSNRHVSVRIDSICDVVRGGSPRPAGSPVYYGGEIPFFLVGDLTKDTSKYLTSASGSVNALGRERSRYIPAGTLMLTNSGATLGVPKIAKVGGCFNDGSQAFLNLSSEIYIEYLYYYFKWKTPWFRSQAARGQGQPNLNTAMTKEMLVPLPKWQEQERVVRALDALHELIDGQRPIGQAALLATGSLLPAVLDRAFRGEM